MIERTGDRGPIGAWLHARAGHGPHPPVPLRPGIRLAGMAYPVSAVPAWCAMSPGDHADGLGGCWGILCGVVSVYDAGTCHSCEFAIAAPGSGDSRTTKTGDHEHVPGDLRRSATGDSNSIRRPVVDTAPL